MFLHLNLKKVDGKMLGPHLILDLYGGNKKKLNSIGFIYKFLDELPEFLDMQKMAPPTVYYWKGSDDLKAMDHGGISGVVLIAESHASIHTFPDRGYASVDIFSCKDFDLEKAAELIIKTFEAKTYEKSNMTRGKHFPRDVRKIEQIATMQRKRASA